MAVDITTFVRELHAFDDRREVVKALKKQVRQPLPLVRKEIRANARAWMPHRGGLDRWVASISILATFKFTGRQAGISVKGGRNSKGGRSDIKRIDAGRVRAPSWGRRGAGQWHTQSVTPGFFTDVFEPGGEAIDAFEQAVSDAVDDALSTIRG